MPRLLDALELATRLIDADPADPQRAGYTVENAALAVIESAQLNADESASLRRMLERRYA